MSAHTLCMHGRRVSSVFPSGFTINCGLAFLKMYPISLNFSNHVDHTPHSDPHKVPARLVLAHCPMSNASAIRPFSCSSDGYMLRHMTLMVRCLGSCRGPDPPPSCSLIAFLDYASGHSQLHHCGRATLSRCMNLLLVFVVVLAIFMMVISISSLSVLFRAMSPSWVRSRI